MKLEIKDRVYRLTSKATPLSFMLRNRNTNQKPLMHFDGETNRALRYARNQKTPFVDEQDDNPILEPIIFIDGFLRVEKSNIILQHFLSLHKDNGGVFEEVDNERDASKEVDELELEINALSIAKGLNINKAESIGRVVLGGHVDRMTTSELRRDIMVYAKNNPHEFLDMLDDPDLDLQDLAQKALDDGIFNIRNKGRDVYYNFANNKKKMLTIPFGETALGAIVGFLKTDTGIELIELLEKKLEIA